MRKITEIPEIKKRTRYKRDRLGKLHRFTEEYKAFKQVPTISGLERVEHYLVDGFFVFLITLPFFIGLISLVATSTLDTVNEVLIAISTFILISIIIAFLYYALFEYKYQRTPGKKSTNSIVVDEYGKRPTLKMIIKRTLYRFVPYEALTGLGNPSYCGHDKWSKTFVIKKDVLQRLLEEINNLEKKD